ncbi:MAG TPA: hypothetical protein VNJ09_03815, partial [Chthonomonadales bacterium]|nr:hypothetical protein [Chthonomonadales bacterium]
MRQDRQAALRERLRRGADAFEFSALIEGVSTLEEPPDAPEALPKFTKASAGNVTGRTSAVQNPLPLLQTQPGEEPTTARNREALTPDQERLRAALDALGCRLLQEVANLRAALHRHAVEEAGFCLAQVNQIVELLRSVDPAGDLARQLQTEAAPPEGRSWPASAWSVVEFMESPFSALLPPDADDAF